MLVAALPRDSTTARALLGEDAAWGLPEHLLAGALDALHTGNWQRAGGKGRRPRRVPRPGVGRAPQRIGRTERDRSEVVTYLARFKPPRDDPPSPLN